MIELITASVQDAASSAAAARLSCGQAGKQPAQNSPGHLSRHLLELGSPLHPCYGLGRTPSHLAPGAQWSAPKLAACSSSAVQEGTSKLPRMCFKRRAACSSKIPAEADYLTEFYRAEVGEINLIVNRQDSPACVKRLPKKAFL